uniref:Uncharacterized protein n=1 Tax=Oryzias sinensis TaxID=183150 RepID=A0A8C7Y2P7_9TELE
MLIKVVNPKELVSVIVLKNGMSLWKLSGLAVCGMRLDPPACPPASGRRQSGLNRDNALKLCCTALLVWTGGSHVCFALTLRPGGTREGRAGTPVCELQAPHSLKAKVMLWRDISYHDMEIIDQIKSVPDLESALCRLFGIDLPEPKRGVMLELYVQAVLFGRKQRFKKEQASALLSIIKSIHEANVGNILKDEEECSDYCVELLLCHSVRVCRTVLLSFQLHCIAMLHGFLFFSCTPQRPPFSINIFTFEQANSILKYLDAVYLKHCKLYKYIFTPQHRLDLFLTYSGMEENASSAVDDRGKNG